MYGGYNRLEGPLSEIISGSKKGLKGLLEAASDGYDAVTDVTSPMIGDAIDSAKEYVGNTTPWDIGADAVGTIGGALAQTPIGGPIQAASGLLQDPRGAIEGAQNVVGAGLDWLQPPVNEDLAAAGGAVDSALDTILPEQSIQAVQVAQAKAADPLDPTTPAQADKVKAQANKKLGEQAKTQLKAEGATKEQLSMWDKFTKEYDLSAIGLSLLASNDGSSNVIANLGKAMIAGKASVAGTADKIKREAMAEREMVTKEDKNRIELFKAHTARIESGLPEGVELEKGIAATDALARNAFAGRGIDLGEVEMGEEAAIDLVSSLIRTEMKNNPAATYSEVATQALDHFLKTDVGPEKTGLSSWGSYDYPTASR